MRARIKKGKSDTQVKEKGQREVRQTGKTVDDCPSVFPHLNDAWWRLWLIVWIVYNLHWSIIDQTSSQKYLKSDLSVINALVSHLLLLCSILKI